MIGPGFNWVEAPFLLPYSCIPIAYEAERELSELAQKYYLCMCPIIFNSELAPVCTMCCLLPCPLSTVNMRHDNADPC
jgi:hypothetical protein